MERIITLSGAIIFPIALAMDFNGSATKTGKK
jgi:hypothetical protein